MGRAKSKKKLPQSDSQECSQPSLAVPLVYAAESLEQLVEQLITQCSGELENAKSTLQNVYEQYKVDGADAATLAVLGTHINKTVELKLKSTENKMKLIDLVHKILEDKSQMEIAKKIAEEQFKNQGDSLDDLYNCDENEDDRDEIMLNDEEVKAMKKEVPNQQGSDGVISEEYNEHN